MSITIIASSFKIENNFFGIAKVKKQKLEKFYQKFLKITSDKYYLIQQLV